MIYEEIINEFKKKSTFFTAEDILNNYPVNKEYVLELISYLIKQRKIQKIYRLKTKDRFIDFDNDWTPHLQTLCKNFKTTKGEYIDGSEFSNIEYKFKILDF